MELLPILRWVWRRRLVLGGALIASVAAFVVLGGSRSSRATSAVAWTQVTLDTPRSQLVAAAPAGADTLSWRASLLTHLMATDTSSRELAQRLGLTQNELAVVDPSFAAPIVQTSMAVASAEAASLVATPYSLAVFLPDPGLPVVSIEAGAPQPSAAERLATAAVAILKSQGSPGGRFSSLIPTDGDARSRTLQPFAIDQVAPVRVRLFPASTLSLKAIAGALIVFLLWCVLGCRLACRLRPRSRALAA
ncbi:MAG: hypothetical protein WAK93_08805 [Solirubrobacteraceae bacterium]